MGQTHVALRRIDVCSGAVNGCGRQKDSAADSHDSDDHWPCCTHRLSSHAGTLSTGWPNKNRTFLRYHIFGQFENWPNRLHSCLTTWNLIDTDNFFNSDDTTTSLLKKVINIYLNCCNQTLWSPFGQFQNCGPNPSAVVANCVHTADATRLIDATRLDSFVSSASAVCVLDFTCCSCNNSGT